MGKEIELIEMGLPVSSVHPPATSILPFIFPYTCLAISRRLGSRECCEPTNPKEGTGEGEGAEQVSIEEHRIFKLLFPLTLEARVTQERRIQSRCGGD